MGAISVDPKNGRASINRDECVECYACYNGLSGEALPPRTARLARRLFRTFALRFEPEPDICPTSAFEPDLLVWPRLVRRAFSDPRVPHESTGVIGRGTEEVKTNEVTNRIQAGEVGFTIEFGRPGLGARFREIEKMSMALAVAGISFEKNNPITTLMSDIAAGTIRPDILNEKIMSAIIEIKVPVERIEEVFRIVKEVEGQIDTIVAIGICARCDKDGEEKVVIPILERLGYKPVRAKTNAGLGRLILSPLKAPESSDKIDVVG